MKVEENGRIIEEMKELFNKFLSIATSTEQLHFIKEKYLHPIQPALFNLV